MVKEEKEEKKIHVSHINIRQSISLMLIKLLVLELIITFIKLLLFIPLVYDISAMVRFILLIIVESINLYFVLLVILQWLNEYYEITNTQIIYRRGLVFRHEQRYSFKYIIGIGVQQGVLGRMLNYGTLHLYDWFMKTHISIYLIHNPFRYYEIIDGLLPNRDAEESTVIKKPF